jgi:hypothetical protein
MLSKFIFQRNWGKKSFLKNMRKKSLKSLPSLAELAKIGERIKNIPPKQGE